MSSLLSAELAATCNALGYFDSKTNKYYSDANTLETVKDLIRYLRRDDESFDIRRQLGETKVVQTDLIPLLKNYWEETDLFDVLLRLVVNLTTPALVLWQEELPTDRAVRNHYLQIEEHLQCYKEAFADEAIWAVLSTRMSKILEIEFTERGDDNSLIIERILILIRNILYVPADPDAERRPDNDASIHDQVLWALHQSGMLDIILYVSSSITEQAYYMHVLEILSFMLREQSASELAHAAVQRSQTEKLRDEAELLAIRHRENNQRQQKVKMYNGARHSRFGGTFVVKSMKSIGDNELIYHKPLNKLDSLNFDVDKKQPKLPKNRLPMQSSASERRSAFSIRLFLKEFCVEYLNGAYNTLMYQVRSNLARAKVQAHDESYYLWAMRFFMEFNRCYKFEVKLVSETMSVQSFHFVQQQMENYFDMITSDKKKLRVWSRRLHLALLAYRELLHTVCVMDKSPDASVKQSAKVIKSNIFYVLEYRELILTLLVTFDEMKMSHSYLNDLLETQHIFLRMLQSYCGRGGAVVVQKKSKGKRKTHAAAASSGSAPDSAASGVNLEQRWDEAAPQLSAVLEGHTDIPTDVVPFDATSDVPIDDQKSETMKTIQRKLRDGDYENAVGLLRAAREVWPENDCFGNNIMTPEEEFLALRDIFFAALGENRLERSDDIQQEDEYEEDEEDDLANMQISESDFKFDDFVKRLAHPKIVRACSLALKTFNKNSTMTNYCIVKLLHRIAFECKMYTMMFQASLFRTFQNIYAAKDMPQFKELAKFANYIVRQFVKVAENNPKVYMETLFWKSSRDAFDVEEGYGSYQEKTSAAAKAWTELQEDELRTLFMEHKEKQMQEDVVDWIINNLIDNTRTRRGVLKKLKEMFLLTDYKGSRKTAGDAKIPKQWGEDEEVQLKELYEQFKEAMDPLGCIVGALDVRRPKNRIVEKLLVMGLVQDKRELRKKRSNKSRTVGSTGTGDTDDSDHSDSGRDASAIKPVRNLTTKGKKVDGAGTSKKQQKPKRKSSNHVRLSPKDLAELLKEIVDSGMSAALEWLRESFSDVADDLDDDVYDADESGIPLVPILDHSADAMENALFQKLLGALGVNQPFDEQETYWRIPSSLTLNTLRKHCDTLQQAIAGTLNVVEEEPLASTAETNRDDESSDEDVFDKIRKMCYGDKPLDGNKKPQDTTPEINSAVDVNVPSTSNEPNGEERRINLTKSRASKTKKIRRLVDSDGEDSDNEILQTGKSNELANEMLEVNGDENDESGKRIRTLSDSDTEKPKQKRTRVLVSDDED